MNNDIITLLNFNQNDIDIGNIRIDGMKKIIPVSLKLKEHFCPLCSFKMHSKGFTTRNVNHPMLQDGYYLSIELKQRRWVCTNKNCDYKETESVNFVERYQHNTNLTPLMILRDLKNLSITATNVATKYNVSDTYVHNIVLRYLDPKRLKMPKVLAVDEVHLDFDSDNLYALVLMNWETGEIVDILPNRHIKSYEDYFIHIPIEERNNVEFVVCDMYNPYISFTQKYFRKGKCIIDSFHVSQWLLNAINMYINDVKKRYQAKDKANLNDKNYEFNLENKSIKQSKEVYLLNRHKWVLLKNKENINYSEKKHWDCRMKQYLNTYDYENNVLKLDSNFEEIRKLKEKYIDFNSKFPMDKQTAIDELSKLINEFSSNHIKLFRDFALILKEHSDEIINSFITPSSSNGDYGDKLRRISNGPIEGFNRKPKDLKRSSRGFSNFNYTRARILWSTRDNEPILANPKPEKEIHTHTNIRRGHYNKSK